MFRRSHEQLNMNAMQKCIPKLKITLPQKTDPTPHNESGEQRRHIYKHFWQIHTQICYSN